MRAILISSEQKHCEFETGQSVVISGDQHHHLTKVVRVKVDEKILLLNGMGLKVITKILSIDKKSVKLEVLHSEQIEDKRFINLFLGLPKRDALELSIKMSVELGVKKIFLYESEFSQLKISHLKKDRLHAVVESALIQSNNPYQPEIEFAEKLEQRAGSNLFLLSPNGTQNYKKVDNTEELVFFIGPEGGWSLNEEQEILSFGAVELQLGDHILRTPTAVAAAMGYGQSIIHQSNN